MSNMICIRAAGQIELIEVGEVIGLKQLQTAVGGYIETAAVTLGPRYRMVVNEEGKLNGLPVNVVATVISRYPDLIVGDVVICAEDGEELIGLDERELSEIMSVLNGIIEVAMARVGKELKDEIEAKI